MILTKTGITNFCRKNAKIVINVIQLNSNDEKYLQKAEKYPF